jgi:hypothetical protein
MEEPLLHIFGLTKLDLRQFSGMLLIWSFDLYRTLANFRLVPVFAEDTFHKPSDIACHASLLTEFLGGNLSKLPSKIIESVVFHFDANKKWRLFSSVHVA